MRPVLALLLIVLTGGAGPAPDSNPPAPGFDAENSDPRAVAVADRTMEAMGGRTAWDSVQCLGWTIFDRTHVWNKWTGDYRLEDDTLTVIMNLNTGVGRAWRGAAEVTDAADLTAVLKRGRAVWINDSYWLLMPYKLKDTGVTLDYAGERESEDGRACDVIRLSFGNVGETPHNGYEVFVDRESGLVAQWSYYPDAADAEPKFTLPWTDWRPYGGIMLSTGRGRGEISGVRVTSGDERAAFAGP